MRPKIWLLLKFYKYRWRFRRFLGRVDLKDDYLLYNERIRQKIDEVISKEEDFLGQ